MRSGMNPYNNEAGLVDKFIGTAYEHVKNVSESIPVVRHVSENMEAVHDFTSTKDVFEAFIENPDFLPWLQANEETLENLSSLLASLVQEYVRQDEGTFTGFVRLGEQGLARKEVSFSGSTPVIGDEAVWAHSLDPSKIVGIQGVVRLAGNVVETLGSLESSPVRVWCDGTYMRLSVAEEAVDYASRPFTVILSYME